MPDTLAAAVAAIAGGGVVAIPTDTVYGLACDPGNADAVARVYAIKRRPEDLELSLLGADSHAFSGLVEMTPAALDLATRYWPGGLSIIVPVGRRVLAVPRRGHTLSVRVPDHALLLALLARTGVLATTSANRHGEPAAATAAAVEAVLGAEVDAIVDGGRGLGQASTIIDCSVDPPRVLREGPITVAELRPRLKGAHTEGTDRE